MAIPAGQIEAGNAHADISPHEGSDAGQILGEMSCYYGYRACAFFETVGSLVSVMSALMALTMLLKHGELNPILSAGIPSYRLAVPLLFGNVAR